MLHNLINLKKNIIKISGVDNKTLAITLANN